MIIGVVGPYSAPTAELHQANLDAMNAAAAHMLEMGHVPLIGMNAAIPVLVQANVPHRNEAVMDISLAVMSACDALLLVGESPGAIKARALILAQGKPVYLRFEDVPQP